MNSASARLKAFPETFDEKIRRRLGPELGPMDFSEELFIDVAADVWRVSGSERVNRPYLE